MPLGKNTLSCAGCISVRWSSGIMGKSPLFDPQDQKGGGERRNTEEYNRQKPQSICIGKNF
jgi:hypothetical protein